MNPDEKSVSTDNKPIRSGKKPTDFDEKHRVLATILAGADSDPDEPSAPDPDEPPTPDTDDPTDPGAEWVPIPKP